MPGSFSSREMTPSVPRLAASRPSSAQSWRANATVEVLPPVPVTAAMICGWRRRSARPSAPGRGAAPSPSSRRRRPADPRTCCPPAPGSPTAPAFAAAATKLAAVGFAAGQRGEQHAGLHLARIQRARSPRHRSPRRRIRRRRIVDAGDQVIQPQAEPPEWMPAAPTHSLASARAAAPNGVGAGALTCLIWDCAFFEAAES